MGEPAADNREVGAPWEVRLALPEDRSESTVLHIKAAAGRVTTLGYFKLLFFK